MHHLTVPCHALVSGMIELSVCDRLYAYNLSCTFNESDANTLSVYTAAGPVLGV
jgi:hypothetical protein